MLRTVFSFRGLDYKGNRIPESIEHLQEAGQAIKRMHIEQQQPEFQVQQRLDPSETFTFTCQTYSDAEEQTITDDHSLLNAIQRAFQGPSDSYLMIKFIIHEIGGD